MEKSKKAKEYGLCFLIAGQINPSTPGLKPRYPFDKLKAPSSGRGAQG